MSLVGGRGRGPVRRFLGCGAACTQAGFTLIEVMVTVAIVAILAAIAYPSYADYLMRGRIVDATNTLSATRARMEQYYQDNRTYASVSTSIVSPCTTAQVVKTFTVVCGSTPTGTSYTATATGSGVTAGFVYTINQSGTQATTSLPNSWGGVPSGGYACWITRKGETC